MMHSGQILSTQVACRHSSKLLPNSNIIMINEFRCYEAKIKESEKAGSHQESNPGDLAWATSTTEPQQSDNHQPPTTPFMYCTDGTECLSHIPDSHPVCAVRTSLGVNQKIFSGRKEPMLSGFSHCKCSEHLAPHAGKYMNLDVMRQAICAVQRIVGAFKR